MTFGNFLIVLFAVSALGQNRARSPENLIFFSIREESFGVGWTAQARANAYKPFVSYASNGSIPEGVNFPASTQSNFFTVTDLIPGTEYNVSITSVDDFGPVAPGRNQTTITLPAQVQNLKIYAQFPNGFALKWNPVKSATSYQVTVRNNFFQNVVQEKVNGLNFTTLSLSSGELYTIFVSAENRNGKGNLGTLTSYTIAEPFPSLVSFVSNTNSSISVRHTTIVGVKNYLLRATRYERNTELTCTLVNQMCTFDKLLSGVNYNFSILGIYESGSRSQFSSPVTFTTKPAQPVDLNTTSKNFAVTATTDPVVEEQSYTSILKISNGTTSYSFSYSENSSVTEGMTRAIPTDVRLTNTTYSQLQVTNSFTSGAQSYIKLQLIFKVLLFVTCCRNVLL